MLRNAATAEDALRINPEGMHNLRALAYYFFPAEFTNYAWWGTSIAVLGAVLWYYLKPVGDDEEIRQRWIKLFLGIALLTPHFHDHDLTLMAIPTALALKSYGEPVPPSLSVALIVLGLLPLLRRTVYVPLFPIMPIIFILLLLIDLKPKQTTRRVYDPGQT
jgi:hypothetical protein